MSGDQPPWILRDFMFDLPSEYRPVDEPSSRTNKDLTVFGKALRELLCQIGAFRSYPVRPSSADLIHDLEAAIRKMVKEELDRTGRYPL